MTSDIRFRLVYALILPVAGCALKGASPPPRFMHEQHRVAYAMTEADLEQLQFYVSSKVIAHDLDVSGPNSVVLVDAGTPGVAVASGERWIRVRFQKGGEGVVFLATPGPGKRTDSQYTIATENERGGGYKLVRLTKDRVLRVNGHRYHIVEGVSAHLLVDDDTLEKVIGGRQEIEGERLPEP